MSSPGGPRRPAARQLPPFFSTCSGKPHDRTKPMRAYLASPQQGQQTVCYKCNRQFRRSPNVAPESNEYKLCMQCRNQHFGDWLQASCVVS